MVRFLPSSSITVDNAAAESTSNPPEASFQSEARAPPASTTSTIRAISRSDVHRITSGQVILDVQSAVKELVENALDAGSTSIEVRFRNFGLDGIDVVDNGTGIRSEDWASIALPHHTSKIETFDDLASVVTFGFRGEALSALCAHADVTVLTATQDDAPLGTLLEFGKGGQLVDSSKKLARQRGTTVSVEGLFRSLPVRRRELEKNCKREYGKAQALLQSYAIISRGVRWSSFNVSGASSQNGGLSNAAASIPSTAALRKTTVLAMSSSSGADYLTRNFASLFGAKTPASLQPSNLILTLESPRSRAAKRPAAIRTGRHTDSHEGAKRARLNRPDNEDKDEGASSDAASDSEAEQGSDGSSEIQAVQTVLVRGIISRPSRGCGRTTSDRQFLYVNGRPWENVKITRAFNEVYRQFNTNQVPMVVADFLLEAGRYDVNVSPDKRTIFLHGEQQLIEALKIALEELFAPTRQTLSVRSLGIASLPQAKLNMATQGACQADDGSEILAAEESGEDGPGISEHVMPSVEPEADGDERDSTKSDSSRHGIADASSDGPECHHAASQPTARGIIGISPAAFTTRSAVRSISAKLSSASSGVVSRHVDRDKLNHHTVRNLPIRRSGSSLSQALHSMLSRHRASQTVVKAAESKDLKYLEESGSEEGNANVADTDDEMTHNDTHRVQEHLALAAADLGDNDSDTDVLDLQSTTHDSQRPPRGIEVDDENSHEDAVDAVDIGYRKHVSVLEDPQLEESEMQELQRQNLASLDQDAEQAVVLEPSWEVRASTVLGSRGVIAVDLESLAASISNRIGAYEQSSTRPDTPDTLPHPPNADLTAAGIDNQDSREVESQLERVISRADFAEMEILGQFNLGFIIARRQSFELDDLFIIDQHAADEKYNFETLQAETKIRSQRLIQPRLLELSATDELVASQHLGSILANGFEVAIDEEAPAGSRIRLISQPVNKGTVFGVHDFEELLFQLREVTPGSSKALGIRCSKARAMFASRACRKSVMIGTALNQRQMSTVVRHMGTIEQPWNCPHGRPTMRHLACLQSLRPSCAGVSQQGREADWSRLAQL